MVANEITCICPEQQDLHAHTRSSPRLAPSAARVSPRQTPCSLACKDVLTVKRGGMEVCLRQGKGPDDRALARASFPPLAMNLGAGR